MVARQFNGDNTITEGEQGKVVPLSIQRSATNVLRKLGVQEHYTQLEKGLTRLLGSPYSEIRRAAGLSTQFCILPEGTHNSLEHPHHDLHKQEPYLNGHRHQEQILKEKINSMTSTNTLRQGSAKVSNGTKSLTMNDSNTSRVQRQLLTSDQVNEGNTSGRENSTSPNDRKASKHSMVETQDKTYSAASLSRNSRPIETLEKLKLQSNGNTLQIENSQILSTTTDHVYHIQERTPTLIESYPHYDDVLEYEVSDVVNAAVRRLQIALDSSKTIQTDFSKPPETENNPRPESIEKKAEQTLTSSDNNQHQMELDNSIEPCNDMNTLKDNGLQDNGHAEFCGRDIHHKAYNEELQGILSLIQVPTEQLRIIGTRVSRILHEGDGLHELPALSNEKTEISKSAGEKVQLVLNVKGQDDDDNLMKMKLMERSLEKATEEVRDWRESYTLLGFRYLSTESSDLFVFI